MILNKTTSVTITNIDRYRYFIVDKNTTNNIAVCDMTFQNSDQLLINFLKQRNQSLDLHDNYALRKIIIIMCVYM